MELYEQIRREYEFGAGTIMGVARKLGVHRRMVREAVRSAMPARRKKTERPQVKMAGCIWVHRCDSGSRPEGATQAAAYGEADLGANAGGSSWIDGSGADGAAVCGAAQARTGLWAQGYIRAAELRVGRGSAGGLV